MELLSANISQPHRYARCHRARRRHQFNQGKVGYENLLEIRFIFKTLPTYLPLD